MHPRSWDALKYRCVPVCVSCVADLSDQSLAQDMGAPIPNPSLSTPLLGGWQVNKKCYFCQFQEGLDMDQTTLDMAPLLLPNGSETCPCLCLRMHVCVLVCVCMWGVGCRLGMCWCWGALGHRRGPAPTRTLQAPSRSVAPIASRGGSRRGGAGGTHASLVLPGCQLGTSLGGVRG